MPEPSGNECPRCGKFCPPNYDVALWGYDEHRQLVWIHRACKHGTSEHHRASVAEAAAGLRQQKIQQADDLERRGYVKAAQALRERIG